MTVQPNETWETDGSPAAESASYKWRLGQAMVDNRELRGRIAAGLVELDEVLARTRPGTPPHAALRRVRIALSGDARSGRDRADALVEEWLKDPDRNVFGLAADLLDALPLRP